MGSRVATLLPRVGFASIALAALVVPVLFVQALADPFSLPKATVVWVTAIVVLLGLAGSVAVRRAAPFPPLRARWPIALLVGWTVLATVVSEAPGTSLVGSYARYDGLASLVAGVVIAAGLVAFTWRVPDRLEVVAGAFAASAVLGLAYVAIERAGWDWIDWNLQGVDGFLVGLGGNPNFSGAHLALAVPIVIAARARLTEPWARHALTALAIALGLGVVATGTRGGLIALVGGVAAVGLFVPALVVRPVRYLAVAATVGLLGLVVISTVADEVPRSVPFRTSTLASPGGISQRSNIWASAGRVVLAHPVVGVGPDGLGRVQPRFRSSRSPLQLMTADEAHDVFLDRAATAGLPALAAQLWLLAVVLGGAWRARARLEEGQRWLLGAFGGMLVAYLLQGLFSIDAVALLLASWLSIGALVALADPTLLDRRIEGRLDDDPDAGPVGLGLAIATLALGAVLVALALRPAIADRQHRRAQLALAAGDPVAALAHDQAAASWLGHEPTYRAAQADALVALAARPTTDPELRRTLLDEVIVAYDRALDRSPDDVRLLVQQAQAHVLAAAADEGPGGDEQLAAGEATYRRLIDELRAADDLHLPFGQLLEAQAGRAGGEVAADRLEEAAEQFELAARYRLHQVDARLGLARVRVAQGRLDDAVELIDEAEELGGPSPALREARRELERQIADADGAD